MKWKLAEIVTKDKLELQGIYYAPQADVKRAILWIHGLVGKFYGDIALLERFAEACEKKEMGFASFNTRGHDMLASFHRRKGGEGKEYVYETIGSGMEIFEECVWDIEAGISYLLSQGVKEIILAGHSTGANKVCYFAATQNHPKVSGIVLSGPMSDRLSMYADKAAYEKTMSMLEELMKSGRDDTLLTQTHFFPLTARRAWSLLAPNTAEDIFNYGDAKPLSVFETIRIPRLVVFAGEDENADRPIKEIRHIFDTHAAPGEYTSVIIQDTSHGYTGREQEFVDVVTEWSKSV